MGVVDYALSLSLSLLMAGQPDTQITTNGLLMQLPPMPGLRDEDVETVCHINPCFVQTRAQPTMWAYEPGRAEVPVMRLLLLYRHKFLRVEDIARAMCFEGVWINEQDVLQVLMRNTRWLQCGRWVPGDAIVWCHR